MKIFAHRGWSAGAEENTLEAFKKSAKAGLDGVEFDVRWGFGGEIVVVHDHSDSPDTLTFENALAYLKNTNLELLIELKEYSPEFFARVIELLTTHGLKGKTTLFAFNNEARQFPWEAKREISLGIISEYPHHIKRDINLYKPDMILCGWGNKKERFIFKLVWSVLSLSRTIKKYPAVKFIAGVAYDARDIAWLAKQGVYGVTADRK